MFLLQKKLPFLIFIILGLSCSEKETGKIEFANFHPIQPGDSEETIIQKAAHVIPTARQLRWQELELTGFFHFGINTFTGKEWGDGKEDPSLFNPTDLDVEQWVLTAKQGGIRQVILTAKHHDGFCLWPTATTSHSVVSSPWKEGKGDVVKEVAEACEKHDVGFGVYLSPWDMNAPMYGTEEYNNFFVAQLTELLTQYGKIDEVWFDGANGEGPNGKKQEYDFNRWYSLIRELQPEAVIAIMGPDVRWVGTETGYGKETEWSVVPVNNLSQDQIAESSQKDVNIKPAWDKSGEILGARESMLDAKGLVWYPAETDVSIRPGWFFHENQNNQVKSVEKLLDIYFNSVGKNGVLLLNIPPDKSGRIHSIDSSNLVKWKYEIDKIFSRNIAEAGEIYSSDGSDASNLIDGDQQTFWTPKDKGSLAELVLEFGESQLFNVLNLQEYIQRGQRVEEFILEVEQGSSWTEIVKGTTIGYKRMLKFPDVEAKKVRLRILSSRLNPQLSEIGLYYN